MELELGASIVSAACAAALAAGLVVASVTDLRRRTIPNACVAAVAASGLARSLLRAAQGAGPAAALEAAAGCGVVLALMLAAAWLSERAGGGSGVGGGDVKLLAAVGTWAGPVGGLVVVGLSCAFGLLGWGAAWALARARRRGAPERGVPLGPAIAIAAVVVLVAVPPVG